MAFTADLDNDIGRVRFEIDDMVEATALFPDDAVVTHALDEEGGNVRLAAARLCDVLSRRFAREFDFATDDQSFKKSQRVKAFADLACELRKREQSTVGVLHVEREHTGTVEEPDDLARYPEGLHGPPLGAEE